MSAVETTIKATPAEHAWHQIFNAPKNGTWLRVTDGEHEAVAHFAQDLTGGEQPAFKGWFREAGGKQSFVELDFEPTHWQFLSVNDPRHVHGPIATKEAYPRTKRRETVNHPRHYGGDTTYEVIKVLEAWDVLDFCLGNTIKYVARAGKKDPAAEVEDLKKAAWYLNRRIEQLTGKSNENTD